MSGNFLYGYSIIVKKESCPHWSHSCKLVQITFLELLKREKCFSELTATVQDLYIITCKLFLNFENARLFPLAT